ncbi:MAG: sodium:sulfate symporter [Anaerocolumna sp.]|jgi:sodium-dependent dicarboxylate transporter 2/3/5|nr:sodium:sulfate symporter [Anaerocolumna sp.]
MKNDNFDLKRPLIIAISLIFIFFFKHIPAPVGMTQAGMNVIGIFLGCLILWLTIAIDWPSLLAIGAIGLMPEIGFKPILASSFGNETFAFLLATFLCTYALSETPFLRRCAISFITSPLAKKGPWQFTISFFAAVIVIGSFTSPTVLFVIFLPILEEIYTIFKLKKGDKSAEMLMIGLVICTSISAGMTPIAHVFSIMAMGFYESATGMTIGYAPYMAFAIPVGIICVILMMAVFKYILRPDLSNISNADVSSLKHDLKLMDGREKTILSIFMIVVALWVFPSILKPFAPDFFTKISGYGTAMPPILGVIILSIISIKGEPMLNFSKGMKNGIPWASLVMAVGTLAIGSAMTNKDIGLSSYLVDTLGPMFNGMTPLVLIIIFTLWAAIQTNMSSNMVTVTVVTAVAIPLVTATNGVVNTAAIVSIIGMMSAYAFATPPAMPHVAIAAGSGWVSTASLFKYGTILMIVSVVVTVAIGYPIANILM